MADTSYLDWPFFASRHRQLHDQVENFAAAHLSQLDHDDVDTTCRNLVQILGESGLLVHSGVSKVQPAIDVRSLCLIREILARYDGLADFAFAMQGLGSMPLSLFGTADQQAHWLTQIQAGKAISAFALTEPQSGSDVANMALSARQQGKGYVLNGEKTWISNGGIADLYTVFARTGEQPGAKGLSAFLVAADTPGLHIAERLEAVSPHPLARLVFEDVRLDADAMLGNPGDGFRIAMASLDNMRSTVGAAALGFARRALDETLTRTQTRRLFDAPLANLQLVQAHIADMALSIDASALLVYRAAWTKDSGAQRITREASMAKLFATEQAQLVVDQAVQIHGGDGVRKGHIMERLYREVRALRIYEGATDVQKIIIARSTLSAGA